MLNKPVVRFTKDKVEPKGVARDSSALKKLLDSFMPLQINRCEVNQGRIVYIDLGSKPAADLQMINVHILAENLRNSYGSAKDKKLVGYVKPFLKDLDVLGKEDRHDNILGKIWEGLVGTVGVILKNKREDQIATKIPFQGDLDSPGTNVVCSGRYFAECFYSCPSTFN